MIRRKTTIALLALGTVLGYASGLASLGCHAEARRQAFERHVASLCVDAARDADRPGRPPARSAAAGAVDGAQANTGAAR
ncbi:uncharacterized protein SOCE26_024810 [Sorangium cellulosum]|uniref:Secreted protein n=1 Tax=Sorangium cellulosum TaxID=56 RepID=A0A2L0EP59_SORCE|nr:hypothetical protein [Sorangium cellulosum]AUX41076.1 uncharacterized protein SOCE26_024810 [Sorangium cellulosum]